MRIDPRPPIVPPFVPEGYIANLPDRGEVFYRHHRAARPGEPTVLLLHGWTATADIQWFTAYQALGERYSYVAIDHRGHGRGLRTEQTYTLEDAADDAAALVRSLGVGPVVAVGYSMGGPIAMLLARRHPDVVQGLVLEATALEWSATRRDRAAWWFLLGMEAMLRSRFTRRAMRRWLAKHAAGNPVIEPWLPWLTAEAHRGDPTMLTDAGRALRTYDARPWASALAMPAGLLLTTLDQLVRPEKQLALARALDAEVVEVASDHFAAWRAAEAFASATRHLVDGVVGRVRSGVASAAAS